MQLAGLKFYYVRFQKIYKKLLGRFIIIPMLAFIQAQAA
jgi:hypothetical protein